jgi:hypothetical protein
MAFIRSFCLSLFILLGGIFCLVQFGLLDTTSAGDDITFIFIDFEDNSEPLEDKNGENIFKEYQIDKFKSLSVESLYLAENSKFGEFNFDNSLEVLLEVVTPPPEV